MGKEIVPVVNYYDLETGYPHVDLVERTLWERFMDWWCPSPLAAEERALMQQITRRLKMRNDIQEARLKRKLARAAAIGTIDNTKVVGTVKIPFVLSVSNGQNRNAVCLLELTETELRDADDVWTKTREICFVGARLTTGDPIKQDLLDACERYVKHCETFIDYLRPWETGSMSTEQLKRAVDSDPKLGEKIKVFV